MNIHSNIKYLKSWIKFRVVYPRLVFAGQTLWYYSLSNQSFRSKILILERYSIKNLLKKLKIISLSKQ